MLRCLVRVDPYDNVFIISTSNLPLVCVSSEEILHEAQKFTQITPMEVDILFELVNTRNQTGYDPLKNTWPQTYDDYSALRTPASDPCI